jgi:hypothetical protein
MLAIWSVDTLNHGWFRLNDDVKLNLLEKAVRKLSQDATYQQIAGLGGGMAGVFVAPEYLFADMTSDVGKQVEESSRWLISTTLRRLSNDYPRILLFPGTIAYRERISTKGDARQALDLMRQHLTTLQAPTMEWHVPRLALGNQIGHYSRQHQAEIDSHKTKMQKLEEKARGIRKREIYAARNTAFGLVGGQVVMTYHKRGEVGEVTDQDEPVFFVNGNRPGRCTVANTTFGVEVCKDSTEGYLRGSGMEEVDVHVVMSASVEIRDVRKLAGTFLVHACQAAAHSGVTDTNDNLVDPDVRLKVSRWNLDLYDVTF